MAPHHPAASYTETVKRILKDYLERQQRIDANPRAAKNRANARKQGSIYAKNPESGEPHTRTWNQNAGPRFKIVLGTNRKDGEAAEGGGTVQDAEGQGAQEEVLKCPTSTLEPRRRGLPKGRWRWVKVPFSRRRK